MSELKVHKISNNMQVVESIDNGLHHLSISHKHRLPQWDEIKNMRGKFGDPNKFYAIVLPPKQYYVNVHKFCMHVWEVKSEQEINTWKGM